MEILLAVVKYTFLGLFVFIGALIVTKSVGKLANKSKNKDSDDKY